VAVLALGRQRAEVLHETLVARSQVRCVRAIIVQLLKRCTWGCPASVISSIMYYVASA
jgi:hypothetical protein